MVREDLIEGAVTFLQDPSVSTAPLEQRIAFLRSKNLTQDEVDASLARVGQATPTQAASSPPITYSSNTSQYRPPPQQYGNYQQPPPYWGAQPPPAIPRRDWRDWFIMATVLGGVGYGLYWTAARYVYPLIAPPTPPQLEQDKAAIDTSFDKAFALLDQLATDTQELKDSEKTRTERLDRALSEVESVLGRMKEANADREAESKRMARELSEIKEQIPRAIEREKETTDGRLKDLAGEMKSLKTLVANRMAQQGSQQGQAPQQRLTGSASPYGSYSSVAQATGRENGAPAVNGTGSPAPETNGTPAQSNGVAQEDGKEVSNLLSDRSASPAYSAGSRLLGGKAQIPAWQLAAKKRNEEAAAAAAAKKESSSNGGSGAATPAAVQDVGQSGTAAPEEAEAGA